MTKSEVFLGVYGIFMTIVAAMAIHKYMDNYWTFAYMERDGLYWQWDEKPTVEEIDRAILNLMGNMPGAWRMDIRCFSQADGLQLVCKNIAFMDEVEKNEEQQ